MMNDYSMPIWKDMSNFEKIMTILEWVLAIVYVAICLISKWNIPIAAHYLVGGVFLASGLSCWRTKRKLAWLYIAISAVELITITISIFAK